MEIFFYPHNYQYDFKSKDGKAYKIKFFDIECTEVSIRQLMSDYADDFGSVKVKFKSGNIIHEVLIHGGKCTTPLFIGGIVDFIKDFNLNYSGNWNYYHKVKELESANGVLVKQIAELEVKLQKTQSSITK